jgi:hypothetical protein
MSSTSALSSPPSHSAAVAEHLATGYIALRCAAITAEQLVAADPTYQGTAGWDLQTAITDACTAVENAVCVHELGTHHRFWDNPRTPKLALAVVASHHDPDPQVTATWLVLELTAAFTDLSTAAGHAETLIATDHYYDHQYGYVGGLGWDLETAVDDAVIAIRDAMRVGTLATINTAFWADKLYTPDTDQRPSPDVHPPPDRG